MASEPTVDSLSEAFGFNVSPAFQAAIRAAIARSPEDPQSGLHKFGLTLGGPLYSFVGGSAQSLRTTQMPPEFFPFAKRPGRPDAYIGFLVDSPTLEGPPNTTFALCVPEHSQRSGVVARDEQELFRWLGAHLDDLDNLGLSKGSSSYQAGEARDQRASMVTYQTADQMGVMVTPENAPLSLIHQELRCGLIEKREIDKVRQAGHSALRVGAPGAALALARDVTWWLGHRDHWFQLATELYEEAYAQLERPLLIRIARREWARLYGRRS
jgi:hypothetical protein